MVSLADSGIINRGGAYPFLDNSPEGTVETEPIDSESLPLTSENFVMTSYHHDTSMLIRFTPTRLHWTTIVNGFLYVVYVGLCFTLPFAIQDGHKYPPSPYCSQNPDIYLGYFSVTHVGLCTLEAILFSIQLYGLYRLKTKGYVKFFNSVWWIVAVPVLLSAIALAGYATVLYTYAGRAPTPLLPCTVDGLLLVLVAAAYTWGFQSCAQGSGLVVPFGYFLLGVVALEALLALAALVAFAVRCYRFNSQQLSPDSLQSAADQRQSTVVIPPTVGYRESSTADSMLERQAETIRHLQQHNASLAKKILQLQQDDNNKF